MMGGFKYLDAAIADMAANHDVFAAEMGGERVNALLHAARAYRDLLANGQRVWWCVDKEAGHLQSLNCYSPRNAPELHNGCGWRLLSVYPKEAENEL